MKGKRVKELDFLLLSSVDNEGIDKMVRLHSEIILVYLNLHCLLTPSTVFVPIESIDSNVRTLLNDIL